MAQQTIYVSATPADYELSKSKGVIVEQIIRPTGLTDPEVEVRPAGKQVEDLLEEVRLRAADNERVLVTTLTKRMAEDLTEYFADVGVKVRYLHSDIDTLERTAIIRDLRKGEFDVLVGINLLREGLGHSRGVAGGHPGRGQGRLPAQPRLSHSDHWPRRPQPQGQGHPLRGQNHGVHAAGARRNERRREVQRKYNQDNRITPQAVKKNILDLRDVLYHQDVDALRWRPSRAMSFPRESRSWWTRAPSRDERRGGRAGVRKGRGAAR